MVEIVAGAWLGVVEKVVDRKQSDNVQCEYSLVQAYRPVQHLVG